MIQPSTDQRAVVTIDGRLCRTHFHFKVVDVWSQGSSSYVFFDQTMTEPAQELFNRLCMWGGHSKIHPSIEGAMGWEFAKETIPVLQAIIDRTRHNRPEDVCR